ncbi:hypothetical protein PHYSODRAFT_338271 [Phytophthora sojae]|uniref:Uncharacterized protein n=1 Tax=Phytophthora sojae (strain P6497) TaxID=1094619 RepID=G5A3W9_PHYSP|nr:hypothetical protein PHYSODRAFT_338271 [Phytophthora sojae]EGZ09469.1 hypothetical protein PHYSODRAFT_338271 [Phytophthora sojae]|eukprot:XP_009534330.1 hypothetical protein PHYSODRAFT_338271 [Phytophthora sojae]
MIPITVKAVDESTSSGDERVLQEELFTMLRYSSGIKKVKQVYYNVYQLASCVCPEIRPKSTAWLKKRWESLGKRQLRRNRDNEGQEPTEVASAPSPRLQVGLKLSNSEASGTALREPVLLTANAQLAPETSCKSAVTNGETIASVVAAVPGPPRVLPEVMDAGTKQHL